MAGLRKDLSHKSAFRLVLQERFCEAGGVERYMVDRVRNLVKHLSEGELDRLQAEADEIKEYKRLIFLKRLYDGATLAAAAEDVGISQATASNWVTRWNEGGLGKLTLNFGDSRPSNLDETEQQQLVERLREGQP